MTSACFIPIKQYSERVKGKNFRVLNGKPLFQYIIDHSIEANVFDDIYVDTDSEEVKEYAKSKNVKVIDRLTTLSSNSANGNDLLNYHFSLYPNYDQYFQLFATAPFLQPKSISSCVKLLSESNSFDSCFTAIKHQSFFWFNSQSLNYRPCILPRSQDMTPLVEETTGLYGIKKEALSKYKCRIGAHPHIFIVDKFEAVDINSEEDLMLAEQVGKAIWNI